MAKKRRTLEDGYSLYELPEVVITEPSYKKFLNNLPLPVQQYLQSEARNNILAKQFGTIDNLGRGTISKEDAERNKRNYFDVQALNTAMGSPYVMNQNSFNYNPNIANQQLQYGSQYPISSIINGFEGALGDVALNHVIKGIPIALDKMGFFVRKPNSFTRGIGETVAGIRDLQRSGVIRGNPYGTEISPKAFGKLYRNDRSNFNTIVHATGDKSIAQKWYARSLSKDEFIKLRNAEIKINGEYKPKSLIQQMLGQGGYDTDFVRQFNTYDDYLKYLEQTKNPTSLDDSGEALAYFYDDGRNPLTKGHDYAASNYGVRVNNASSYNPRIFTGHQHYSFPQAVHLNDPNVEVFRKLKLGPFSITRRINKNDILRGKFQRTLGDMLVSKGMKMITKKAMPITFNRMLNKSIKNWDGTVGAEYFHDPYSWYRITNSVEPAGISELGAQFTTRDMPEYSSIDQWRNALNNIPGISVKKDGYYVNPRARFSFIKNSSAHGNTSQASKGQIWEGTVSRSPLFKQGILEGQAPVEVYQGKTINGSDSRSRFVLTPWDEVPNGARIGFYSKEMPLQGLRWFEALPNGRYKYQGEVIPEHHIRIKHK